MRMVNARKGVGWVKPPPAEDLFCWKKIIMFYKHQYFTINTQSRKVFDENGKELRLTGNAYRVLIFLCQKKAANLSEIGFYLDYAKDYDENHLRQYRYKINSIIGHDVIDYKNGVYSIIGEVKETENSQENNGNTDLLQSNGLKLPQMHKEIQFVKWPAILAFILLLLTYFHWPYGYYTFIKFIITGTAIYYAYYLYYKVQKLSFWFWMLVIIAILFNPIIPIYLYDKTIWWFIDGLVLMFFITLIIKFK